MAGSAARNLAGLALVASGVGLVLFAAGAEGRHAADAAAAEARAHVPMCPPAVTVAAPILRAPTPPPATAAPPTTAAPTGAPSASAPSAAGLAAFKFTTGVIIPKDEIARIMAYANSRRGDRGKIVIEGFADAAGADPKSQALARSRAILVRQLFSEANVEAERITVVTGDVANEPSLATQVRIREAK